MILLFLAGLCGAVYSAGSQEDCQFHLKPGGEAIAVALANASQRSCPDTVVYLAAGEYRGERNTKLGTRALAAVMSGGAGVALSIIGAGAGATTLDGGGTSWLLRSSGSDALNLFNLTIARGFSNHSIMSAVSVTVRANFTATGVHFDGCRKATEGISYPPPLGGGALLLKTAGAVALLDCSFTGNHASNTGGAVFVNAADLVGVSAPSFTRVTFSNNTAGGEHGLGGLGGAVALNGDEEWGTQQELSLLTVVFRSCHFASNFAFGGDNAAGQPPGSVYQRTGGKGGGIVSQHASLQLDDCSFVGCRALAADYRQPKSMAFGFTAMGGQGGALYGAIANLVVTSSRFEGCAADAVPAEKDTQTVGQGGAGGAIATFYCLTNISGSVFDKCVAGMVRQTGGVAKSIEVSRGGAVSIAVGTAYLNAPSRITDSNFTRNTAAACGEHGGNGGALALQAGGLSTQEILISGSLFAHNHAKSPQQGDQQDSRGGAIYAAAAYVSLRGTTLSSNLAAGGGGLYTQSDGGSVVVSLLNCELQSNEASSSPSTSHEVLGGGILVQDTQVRVTGGLLADNRADGLVAKGGAVAAITTAHGLRASAVFTGTRLVDNFANSTARTGTTAGGGGGGMAYAAEAELQFLSCAILGNTARGTTQQGGAMFVQGNVSVVISSAPQMSLPPCTVINNTLTKEAIAGRATPEQDASSNEQRLVSILSVVGGDSTTPAQDALATALARQCYIVPNGTAQEAAPNATVVLDSSCTVQVSCAARAIPSCTSCVGIEQLGPSPTVCGWDAARSSCVSQSASGGAAGAVTSCEQQGKNNVNSIVAIAVGVAFAAALLIVYRHCHLEMLKQRRNVPVKHGADGYYLMDEGGSEFSSMSSMASQGSTASSVGSNKSGSAHFLQGRGASFVELALSAAGTDALRGESIDTEGGRESQLDELNAAVVGAGDAVTGGSSSLARSASASSGISSPLSHKRTGSVHSRASYGQKNSSGVGNRIRGGAKAISNISWSDLQLGPRISAGANGIVYRASYSGATVAVKELVNLSFWMASRKTSADAITKTGDEEGYNEAFDAFFREATILSALQHPQIVTFFGVSVRPAPRGASEAAPSFLLVTELCSGSVKSLFTADGSSDEDDEGGAAAENSRRLRYASRRTELVQSGLMLSVLKQVAAGMTYLHANDVLHRDLKPDNVLIKEVLFENPAEMGRSLSSGAGRRVEWVAKLCDFGLGTIWKPHARGSGSAQDDEHVGGNARNDMTGMVGTPNYMAPELIVAGAASLTGAIDVYSFGCCIWALFTGRSPHGTSEFSSVHALLGAIVRQRLRPEIPDDMPQDLSALMQACWAHDPAKRPSFAQISEQLSAPARLGLASSDGDPQLVPTESGSVSAASGAGTLIRKP